MPVLRREPRSEGSNDAAIDLPNPDVGAAHPGAADLRSADPRSADLRSEDDRCDEYSDARELATTWAEHADVDHSGWCRSHWAD